MSEQDTGKNELMTKNFEVSKIFSTFVQQLKCEGKWLATNSKRDGKKFFNEPEQGGSVSSETAK